MNKLHKKQAPFTQVPNELLLDRRLSLKAKGLYALMYSKPDDWTFYESALIAESKDGKDAVHAALKELIETGWLLRSRERHDGRFTAYDYELLVDQSGKADAANPQRESRSGKPASTNTDPINTDEIIPPMSPSSRFDEFWSAWPAHTRKVDRKGCERKWKAGGLDAKADAILQALEAFKASWDWRKNDGAYIPMPATWLHQERWDNAPALCAPAEETKPNF